MRLKRWVATAAVGTLIVAAAFSALNEVLVR